MFETESKFMSKFEYTDFESLWLDTRIVFQSILMVNSIPWLHNTNKFSGMDCDGGGKLRSTKFTPLFSQNSAKWENIAKNCYYLHKACVNVLCLKGYFEPSDLWRLGADSKKCTGLILLKIWCRTHFVWTPFP